MNKIYLLCGALAGVLSVSSLFAADATEATEVAEVTELKDDAKNKLQEVFPNAKSDKKNKFFPGAGNIAIPAGQKGYAQARVNAYHKAFADARTQFQIFIEAEVTNAMKFAAGEGEGAEIDPSIQEDVLNTLKAKAAAAGIDANDEAALKKFVKENVLNSSSFKQQIHMAGAGFQQGVMTYGCVVTNDQVACYAHYSARNLAVAKSLWSGQSNSMSGKPGAPLKDQLPKTIGEWSNTFGVRVLRDENGRYCVVGFGHGVAVSKSAASRRNASVKARLQAINEIKNFAGSEIAYAEMQSMSESSTELEGDKTIAKIDEEMRQNIEQKASSLKINGLNEIASKTIMLPSKEIVIIAAYSWYIDSDAQKIYQDMQVGRGNKNRGIAHAAPVQETAPAAATTGQPKTTVPAAAAPAQESGPKYRAVPTTGSSSAADLD